MSCNSTTTEMMCVMYSTTYSQDDPQVQLCILMAKNTENFYTFWKLVKIQLNDLQKVYTECNSTSTIFMKQLTVVQPCNQLPAFYDTWTCTTMFTSHMNTHNFWSLQSCNQEFLSSEWWHCHWVKWSLMFQRNMKNHCLRDSPSHSRRSESSHELRLNNPRTFLKDKFNIIIPSTSSSLKWYVSFKFPNYSSPLPISPITTTCHAHIILLDLIILITIFVKSPHYTLSLILSWVQIISYTPCSIYNIQ